MKASRSAAGMTVSMSSNTPPQRSQQRAQRKPNSRCRLGGGHGEEQAHGDATCGLARQSGAGLHAPCCATSFGRCRKEHVAVVRNLKEADPRPHNMVSGTSGSRSPSSGHSAAAASPTARPTPPAAHTRPVATRLASRPARGEGPRWPRSTAMRSCKARSSACPGQGRAADETAARTSPW